MSKFDLKLSFLEKHKDAGLLFLRVGIGGVYIWLHGWGKLTGGPDRWIRLGDIMPGFGIEGIYLFWGLMAALAETLFALFFAVGYRFRLSAAIIGFTMLMAVIAHLSSGDSWGRSSHALKMMFVFWGLMFVGPGKYSLDYFLSKQDS